MKNKIEWDDCFITGLQEGPALVREREAIKMGLTNDLRAIEPLLEALKCEDAISVKSRIVWALKQLKDPRAIPALINELQYQEDYVQYQEDYLFNDATTYEEYEELHDFDDNEEGEDNDNDDNEEEIENEIDIDDFEYRQGQYETADDDTEAKLNRGKERSAKKYDDKYDPEEDQLFNDFDYDEYEGKNENTLDMDSPTYVETPIAALVSFGPQSFEYFCNALSDTNAMIRANSTQALAHYPFDQSKQFLFNALKDKHMLVRSSAVKALAMFYNNIVPNDFSESIVQVLLDSLPLSLDAMLEFPLIFTDSLIHALKDDNALIKAQAAAGLGNSKNPRAIRPLLQTLTYRDQNVFESVKASLIQIGVEAVEPFVNSLKDELNSIMITNIELQSNFELILENNDDIFRALNNYKCLRDIVQLFMALQHKDKTVSDFAKNALIEIGVEAVEPLLNIFIDELFFIIYTIGQKETDLVPDD